MNDEAARQGRPDTNAITRSDRSKAIGERGVFDLRLHVTGADRMDVWRLVTEFQRAAGLFAPPGVDVRYVQLRPPRRSRTFDATMEPAKRKKRAT